MEDGSGYTDGDMRQRIFRTRSLTTSCLMMRKSLLIKVGMFDELLRFWQDYELLIRLCQEAELIRLKENLTLYRINLADGKRLSSNVADWEQAVRYIEEKHAALIEALPPEVRLAHQKMILHDGVTRCENCGDAKRKRGYLKRLLILEPSAKNAVKFILNRGKFRRR